MFVAEAMGGAGKKVGSRNWPKPKASGLNQSVSRSRIAEFDDPGVFSDKEEAVTPKCQWLNQKPKASLPSRVEEAKVGEKVEGRQKEEEEETSFEMLKAKKKMRSKIRTMKMRVSLRVMMWSILNLRVKIQVGLSIRSIR